MKISFNNRKGEDIGMFGKMSFYLYEKIIFPPPSTKEFPMTFVKNKKEGGFDGKNN